jgi:hypothetical protein
VRVHVYRNRDDDRREPDELYYCASCTGWYGVPHTDSHCQQRRPGGLGSRENACACRFCSEATGRPIEGRYGIFTEAKKWQPLEIRP